MNGLRKPRRARHVSLNPVGLAMAHAGRLTIAEVAAVMTPVQDAFRALREGIATEDQWCLVTSAMNIADAIEREGVTRGMRPHFHNAQQALDQILRRAMATLTWLPTALYFQELDDIRFAVDLADQQLRATAYGEYRRALKYAIAEVSSADGKVIDINHASAQLVLLGA